MSKAEKREEAARKAKEAKQKKILIGLAPLLLLMLAWQGPGMVKAFTGGKEEPPPVAQPEVSGETTPEETTADPTTAPPPTTGGGSAPVGATPVALGLPDTDGGAMADSGQLVTFDRFLGKDPFRRLVEDKADTGDGSVPPPEPPPAGDGGSGGAGNGNGDGGGGATVVYSTATISVNGVRETLGLNATFPASDPIFRLKAISKGGVKIGLVTGSFTDGQAEIAVKVGKSVTLVSQPDGLRFVIRVISVG
jgi:hypothetical protein